METTFAGLKITENETYFGGKVGMVRPFMAHGKRGAVYGCLVYEDGRFQWFNIKRPFGITSVPFDLAQVNPATLSGSVERNAAVQS